MINDYKAMKVAADLISAQNSLENARYKLTEAMCEHPLRFKIAKIRDILYSDQVESVRGGNAEAPH